jgi:hypothetical protein
MKNYQVGYRLPDGHVRYCPLSHSEGMEYNSLKSDDDRTAYIKNKIEQIKIQEGLNKW